MINKNFKVPVAFQEMNRRGFTTAKNYLWLNEMEWIPIDDIYGYDYEEGESETIVPFAYTGGGDKWVWVVNDTDLEYCVGICENAEITGVYYAKNIEDAIIRQIIEYVSDSNFYINKDEAKSYQYSENELKAQLVDLKKKFSGILPNEHLSIIDNLCKKSLKYVKSQYGEWYALLTREEENEIIDKYIRFDKMGEEFEWFSE